MDLEERAQKKQKTEKGNAALSALQSVLGRMPGGNLALEQILKQQIGESLKQAEVPPEGDGDGQEEERSIPEDFPEEFVQERENCVKIWMDSEPEPVWRTPAFVHQAFPRDRFILGYKDLEVFVSYTKLWRALVEIRYSEKLDSNKWGDLLDGDLKTIVQKSGVCPQEQEESCFTFNKEQFEVWRREDNCLSSGSEIDGIKLTKVDYFENGLDGLELFQCTNICDQPKARRMLHQLQACSFWWIESSEQTDVSDHRWKFYLLFQNGALVGFTTKFVFFNPSRILVPHIWRICQSLVLPGLQKKGYGKKMITAIYRESVADSTVFELTIEDPCPEFTRLRDRIEVDICADGNVFLCKSSGLMEDYWNGIVPRHVLDPVRGKLKITFKQIQRCYEILRLVSIKGEKMESVKTERLRRFRLDIKRRFCAQNVEDILSRPTEELKGNLSMLYEDLEVQYLLVIKHLNKAIIDKYQKSKR